MLRLEEGVLGYAQYRLSVKEKKKKSEKEIKNL